MGYQMTETEEFTKDLADELRPYLAQPGPLLIKRLSEDTPIPVRATPGSIGYDVFACLLQQGHVIPTGCRSLIPLGFAMHPPAGTYGRLAPRSGLAHKQGIHVMAGVIDPDYRGEVHVLLLNTGDQPVYIKHGDRIAQLILERAVIAPVVEVNDLVLTERGADGFGSTG